MKKIIASIIMFFTGWSLAVDTKDKRIKHCVLVAAPHTSNWDLLHSLMALWKLGIPVRFLIKDTYTKNIFTRYIVKWLGGIGVNRSQRNDLVAHTVRLLEQNQELALMLSPEGTRSYVKRWKTGFYKIASEAKVPIALAFLDYKHKKGGILGFVDPSGDYKKDISLIKDLYQDITPSKPALWNADFDHF